MSSFLHDPSLSSSPSHSRSQSRSRSSTDFSLDFSSLQRQFIQRSKVALQSADFLTKNLLGDDENIRKSIDSMKSQGETIEKICSAQVRLSELAKIQDSLNGKLIENMRNIEHFMNEIDFDQIQYEKVEEKISTSEGSNNEQRNEKEKKSENSSIN